MVSDFHKLIPYYINQYYAELEKSKNEDDKYAMVKLVQRLEHSSIFGSKFANLYFADIDATDDAEWHNSTII